MLFTFKHFKFPLLPLLTHSVQWLWYDDASNIGWVGSWWKIRRDKNTKNPQEQKYKKPSGAEIQAGSQFPAGRPEPGKLHCYLFSKQNIKVMMMIRISSIKKKTSQDLGNCPMGQREALLKERINWKKGFIEEEKIGQNLRI